MISDTRGWVIWHFKFQIFPFCALRFCDVADRGEDAGVIDSTTAYVLAVIFVATLIRSTLGNAADHKRHQEHDGGERDGQSGGEADLPHLERARVDKK